MTLLPQDISEALQQAGLAEFFAACTPAHRQEYLKWIGEAKRPATRTTRLTQAMAMLAQKRDQEKTRAPKRP